MISIYSVVSSIIFYNLSLVLLFILRRKTDFMARYAISTLLFLAMLSLIRLLTPIDIAPIIIRSDRIVPKLIELLEYRFAFWPLSVGYTLAAVWLICSVAHAVKICVANYRAYKVRKIYPRIKSEQLKRVSAKLDKAYNIVLSPKVSQPYTFGIIRPTIYLPYIEYSDAELYFILLHEAQHIKSLDNLKHLVFLILEVVFWWNPLAHIASDEFELLTEYSCDSKVTANMDCEELDAYLRTIVSVLIRLNPDEDKTKPKPAATFAQTYDIKQRFEVLQKRNDRKPKRIRYAVLGIMLLVFIMSFFVIIQPYYGAPNELPGNGLEEEYCNSYIFVSDGKYYLILDDTIVEEIDSKDIKDPPFNNISIIGG